MTHVTVRNGMTLAYTVALVNALLGLLVAFGVNLNDTQRGAIVVFVNVAVLLVGRVLHLPEKTPDGGTVRVAHVPVLETTPPATVTVPAVAVTSAPAEALTTPQTVTS